MFMHACSKHFSGHLNLIGKLGNFPIIVRVPERIEFIKPLQLITTVSILIRNCVTSVFEKKMNGQMNAFNFLLERGSERSI